MSSSITKLGNSTSRSYLTILPLFLLLLLAAFIGVTTADSATSQFPSPFDTTLNYNLTTSCYSFFKKFLMDQNFKDCRSFGFLLSNSNGFAVASRNVSNIPGLLDQVCNAPIGADQCRKTMFSYAQDMKSSSNCRVDLENVNPIATKAYFLFLTYQVMQNVGCSKNSSDIYCYVDALDKKQGLGIFYLASGTPLATPNAQLPCSECNKKVVNFYAEYAGDATLPLAKTFPPVRDYFNSYCGNDFINTAAPTPPYPTPSTSSASLLIVNQSFLLKLGTLFFCALFLRLSGL